MPVIDFAGFAREVLSHWPDEGIDGFDLQDLGVKHGLLRETTYDPDLHGEDRFGVAEKGDPWFIRRYAE